MKFFHDVYAADVVDWARVPWYTLRNPEKRKVKLCVVFSTIGKSHDVSPLENIRQLAVIHALHPVPICPGIKDQK